MRILVGDVGGTKVNLAICEVGSGDVATREHRRYESRKYGGLSDVALHYLAGLSDAGKISGASFGVPGPVIQGRCRTVNLPWVLEESELSGALGFPARLLNDLEASARGLSQLELGRGLAILREGNPDPMGNQALIAPGTGLGEALLVWDGTRHLVAPSEGGHADFGPQDEEQIDLLRWLKPRHAHVSAEHVASGPAIFRMYRFLKESGREREPGELAGLLEKGGVDASPLIAAHALENRHAICVRAIDLWLKCLGAAAGNLALTALARGGVFIGGGMVPGVTELFRRPAFLEGFEGKGRMREILAAIPIYAVTDSHTGLYGAALAFASQRRQDAL